MTQENNNLGMHERMANALRFLSVDAVESANSGHPGPPLGMADVATVLFRDFLKFDSQRPHWPDRDRFILSAGHGSALLYSLLHLTGYQDFPLDEIKKFRTLGAYTAGHPEYGHGAGIETTTGPLGQGVATSVGMALAERLLNARYGDELVNHNTYVIASDGDLMEGISQEAISLAGHLKLSKLIVLWDDNRISIDGSTDLSFTDDTLKRFEAAGWNTYRVDGHNQEDIKQGIEFAQKSAKPTLVACRTIIGKGAPTKQGSHNVHGSPLGKDEIAQMRSLFGWPSEPFLVPDDVRSTWLNVGTQGSSSANSWENRLQQAGEKGQRLLSDLSGNIGDLSSLLAPFKQAIVEKSAPCATRVASQKVLEVLTPHLTTLLGGSADLTGSNNTKTADLKSVTPDDFSGRYMHYGVREHGMAAAMNGVALHGGFIPYGGTFLVFADYARPSIRLSALMKQRVVYVLTHDSIGLGEDGPTHQPVEHLASLRAIPNLNVFRPADAVEAAECWQIALEGSQTPSVLALSRQNLPVVRGVNPDGTPENLAENKSKRGGYILKESVNERKVTLMATGSEVEIALKTASLLEEVGVGARVVSIPCLDLFINQPLSYRDEVVDRKSLRVVIEAAISQGWEGLLGENGIFVGMQGFGASAPFDKLYNYFGITPQNAVARIQQHLSLEGSSSL